MVARCVQHDDDDDEEEEKDDREKEVLYITNCY